MPLDAGTLKGTYEMLVKTSFHQRWHHKSESLDLDPGDGGLIARAWSA